MVGVGVPSKERWSGGQLKGDNLPHLEANGGMTEPTPADGRRASLTIDLGGQRAKLAQGGVTAQTLARGRRRMKELAGKTAFVTGAASGIGLGIATAFAQAGAKVMLCDI